MTAENILQRLQKVRRTGPGRWSACCPAHDDRAPSLSVREVDDGRVLLHCFGGCAADDVVAAVGLEMADLFPPRPGSPGDGATAVRKPWSASDLLRLASFEAGIIAIIVADMLAGREVDRARLIEAARRLADVAEAANVQ
ncbi:MAG TPA: CHC2 zinc finger domain-containing protein [Rubrivivax sp.]|nr:CHC2 zinc finger domain-containing protein [Rubrivivax sp.]